jgi:hypothetical protein
MESKASELEPAASMNTGFVIGPVLELPRLLPLWGTE